MMLLIISSLCLNTGSVVLKESKSVFARGGGTWATPLFNLPIVALAASLLAEILHNQ